MSLLHLLRPLALAALLLPAAVHAQQVYISAPVQLYAGPDIDYPILLTLYPGVGVNVAGCLPGYQWCDVILPDGQRGWVYGGGLSYAWMGDALPIPQYGSFIGIPLITFIIGDYWGHHYRNQPWYNEPRHWHQPQLRPMPPRAMPYPDNRGGWNQPYPQRQEREWERDHGRDQERERGRSYPPLQERERDHPQQQPQWQQQAPQQQRERERDRPTPQRQEQGQGQQTPPTRQMQRQPEAQPQLQLLQLRDRATQQGQQPQPQPAPLQLIQQRERPSPPRQEQAQPAPQPRQQVAPPPQNREQNRGNERGNGPRGDRRDDH
jgi:uncharacterized protein YraI